MSKLQVDDIVNKDDTGSVGFSRGAVVTGVATATTFSGALTGNVTGNVQGDVTGDVVGGVTGDVTVMKYQLCICIWYQHSWYFDCIFISYYWQHKCVNCY